MTEWTSMEAWREINEEGLITPMELTVIEWLMQRGKMTGAQIDQVTGKTYMHCRLASLEAKGVAHVVEVKPCPTSGRKAKWWSLTGNGPQKTLKAIGKQRRADALKQMRDKVTQLEGIIENQRTIINNYRNTIQEQLKRITELEASKAGQGQHIRPVTPGQQRLF